MNSEKNRGACSSSARWFILAAFVAGTVAGYLLKARQTASLTGESCDLEIRQSGYNFINPLLDCEKADGSVNVLIHSFKKELSSLTEEHLKNGDITDTAIYFRDMNNGPWYGVNENARFRPASLLKVPIAMAFYKAAEENPGILNRRIRFTKPAPLEPGRTQTLLPAVRIELGKEYTVEELIEAMIRYSDNQALFLLYGVIPDTHLEDLYRALGIESDVLKKADGTLSIRSFATFYRVLFNASFLDRKYSEKLLSILSRSDYKNALAAGLPPGIQLAHKFGEGGESVGERQLQDCGIVYYPQRPYLLCVMAKGKKFADLEKFIASVSGHVYARVKDTAGRK